MKCSFCGKPNTEVKCVVAANDKICICDECVLDALKIVVYGEPKPIQINLDDKGEEHE